MARDSGAGIPNGAAGGAGARGREGTGTREPGSTGVWDRGDPATRAGAGGAARACGNGSGSRVPGGLLRSRWYRPVPKRCELIAPSSS